MNGDKKVDWKRGFSDIFVHFGGGSHYIEKITKCKIWNVISWVLIAIGVVAWAAFLTWKPEG